MLEDDVILRDVHFFDLPKEAVQSRLLERHLEGQLLVLDILVRVEKFICHLDAHFYLVQNSQRVLIGGASYCTLPEGCPHRHHGLTRVDDVEKLAHRVLVRLAKVTLETKVSSVGTTVALE